MADLLTSYFHIGGNSIVPGPVQASEYVTGSSNVFPKYADAITETAWELWHFDGVSEDGRAAVVVSITRNAEGRNKGGFKVQVIAKWPDNSTWHRDLYFPESVVTAAGGEDGNILGVWKDSSSNGSISFNVSAGALQAELSFDVPDIVNGRMNLTTLAGDQGLDTCPRLGPAVHYVRPIGRASATADMTFSDAEDKSPRRLLLGLDGVKAHGGMDHVWSHSAWPQVMSESYYLRAQVGPYAMQVMRIFSTVQSGKTPYTTARLYRDGGLVCAAQNIVAADESEITEDSLAINKVDGPNSDPKASGVAGAFRDKNNGYIVEFAKANTDGRRWKFQVLHESVLWNIPTSGPGPAATGNTGFIESVLGGMDRESYRGVGTGGQCELQSPLVS
ncbi:hypothetical protein MGYG_04673 [Nannizzia gypsea CBS 118893]|uniref:Diels-Alderase n=1 Tax=Arthroderma gypseum (strain ATCC MYA-4604 / CBS 118893) TaxID=535722 RepID=E4UW62_ARTGP|nr:hypothetical protein MGYG_04673 [Nannizzia gypsea CBS 118893]EFR01670.1 hypothetical protein MGYG_04673 [Nannizzia gypsea CBS 118893]